MQRFVLRPCWPLTELKIDPTQTRSFINRAENVNQTQCISKRVNLALLDQVPVELVNQVKICHPATSARCTPLQ